MAAGKLYKDIPRMIRNLIIIEQYNNFRQLGAEEDILYLKEKVNNLFNITNTQELIDQFTWCANMINMYYNDIEPDFKAQALKEERLRELRDF